MSTPKGPSDQQPEQPLAPRQDEPPAPSPEESAPDRSPWARPADQSPGSQPAGGSQWGPQDAGQDQPGGTRPGQPQPAPPPYGQDQPAPPYGQDQPPPPYGQDQPAPPPYGQDQPAPPPYGQDQPAPPYGQPAPPPYRQPAYGQPAYGQQPAGRPPYPGQPAYPGHPYSQREKKVSRNMILGFVGIVVAFLVAAVLLFGVVRTVLFGGDPRDTAEEFMAALKAKDVDKAHSLLCDDGRDKVTAEGLGSDFDLDTRTITSYVLGTERTRERDGNEETLIPVTIDYDQGEQLELDLGLWNEGGQKVCSLNPPGDG